MYLPYHISRQYGWRLKTALRCIIFTSAGALSTNAHIFSNAEHLVHLRMYSRILSLEMYTSMSSFLLLLRMSMIL